MRRRRGGVMVLALAVLVGLVAILAAAAANSRVAFKAQLNRMERERARIAAQAGIQRALAAMVNQDKALVGAGDEWELLGDQGGQRFTVGSAAFRMQIVDAAGFLNINAATQQQLERLPLTTEQIDALLDWREEGRTPRTEGAKDEYYNALQHPYNAKLRRFDSIDELLLVKGFTAKTLYEPQTDVVNPNTIVPGTPEDQPAFANLIVTESVSQAPTGRLNVRNATVAQILQRGVSPQVAQGIFLGRQGFQSINDMIRLPGVTANDARVIMDSLSVNNATRLEGRINLNTVSETVLNSIPNMTPDLAAAIVSRQGTPFATPGELATLPGATPAFLGTAADLFTVNSQTFAVRVMGTAGSSQIALTAIISIEGDAPRILSITEEPFDDMVERWGWPLETTSETPLSEGA